MPPAIGPNVYGNEKRPNVIWFMVDQMRAQAMSLAGDPNVHTPNLDRMARDGYYFNQALSGFPLCCPARGSFVTGQYPHQCVPGHEYRLPPAMTTVADPFNEAGYHTAWLGKWHLDGFHEGKHRSAWHVIPEERRGRFKTWIGYDNNNRQYDCWVHGHDEEQEVLLKRLEGHETEVLTDMLIDQIERHKDDDFFLTCSVQPPHDPYTAPAEFAGRHNPANIIVRENFLENSPKAEKAKQELAGYYALIEHIDHNVGRVMAKLEELGLDDSTYVIFCSDHGDQHGSHGYMRKMTPLEESIRVPMIIWGGARWHYNNQHVPYVFNHVDLAPTSLGLCGIPVPQEMQGFDYSAVTRGYGSTVTPPATGPELSEAPSSAYLQCVIPTGHGNSMDEPWRGIVTQDGWKYVVIPGQPCMLYNLNDDPYEQTNLVFQSQTRRKRLELQAQLAEWIEQTGDEFPLPLYDEHGRPAIVSELREKYADHWATD